MVEFNQYEDMRFALEKLDNTKITTLAVCSLFWVFNRIWIKNLQGAVSYIRVKEEHLAAKKNIPPPPRTSPRRRISRSPPTHKRTRIRS